MTDVETTHHVGQSRYEAHLGGELAGYAEYERDGDRVVFTHTVVGEEYDGRGVGSALARFGLEDVRDHGPGRVVAQCSFIRGWIDRHPDFAGLVAPDVD